MGAPSDMVSQHFVCVGATASAPGSLSARPDSISDKSNQGSPESVALEIFGLENLASYLEIIAGWRDELRRNPERHAESGRGGA